MTAIMGLLQRTCTHNEQAAICKKCGEPFISKYKTNRRWTIWCDACNGKMAHNREVQRRNARSHIAAFVERRKAKTADSDRAALVEEK